MSEVGGATDNRHGASHAGNPMDALPSLGKSGRDSEAYITDLLTAGDHYEHSEHGEGGHGGEKHGSFLERHTFIRWAVYALAAFGAWKLGLGQIVKSAFQALQGHFSK